MLFVELPETEEEMIAIGRELGDMPLVANMVEGGRTPMLEPSRLAEIGYALAIYPVAGLLSAAAALNTVYAHIRDTGSSLGSPAPLYSFAEMNRLMGFEEVGRSIRRMRRFERGYTQLISSHRPRPIGALFVPTHGARAFLGVEQVALVARESTEGSGQLGGGSRRLKAL